MVPGRYYGKIMFAQSSTSSKGTPQIVIDFSVTHMRGQDGKSQAIDPTPAKVYVYLSPEAYDKSEARLKKLGFNFNFAQPSFSEKGGYLDMKLEEYQGKTREKWELPGGGPPPLTAEMIRDLNARHAALSGGQTAPPSDAGDEPPMDEAPTGDDIPF